ncbi:MAG: transglycosylase SLT domain-containing protein [Actinobacteria bacterium]|nr:transglycosylase SLT domain-containing protein [Actinomycetota bacterium]MCI0544591.1 transglycosylase SLT domain-containing protein [Actinomycetota bacterium]MCI0678774.1 transglycosylase SLT domain-containing protein [Actinomycetota bacterium]
MRSRRFSFLAGWSAVALLALAGFAAFGNPGPDSQQVVTEAAAASLGHTAGAYAGLGFARMGLVELETVAAEPPETEDEPVETVAAGTIATPGTGWLSEVEVRALISLYFEPADINRAVRIAWCESRFDPASANLRTGGLGLFQHLPQYWEERAANAGFSGAAQTDPEASVAAAAWAVYQGGGWDVFACQG